MAPLPQNSTNRMFYDYISQTGGVEHTFACRFADGLTHTQVHEQVYQFLSAGTTSQFLTGWQMVRARVQNAGTNFTTPVVLSPDLSGFVGTGGAVADWLEPLEVRFVGRAFASGRRATVPLFGLAGINASSNYRIEFPDAAYVNLGAMWAELDSQSTTFVAIDGNAVTYYPYVDWQFNSYWEREVRSGV